ncbi:MAG: NAD-dependent epimerase/dehydratase family protein, partial [Alphaproteobacteria bacterium]|nr:NAD-dependent epimerase/dehydratase family protein [Alphaproteobacteria bacterium]
MRILVIGGAGYIGSHVVKDLLANGHEVTVFDNLSSGHRCNLFPNAAMAEGDITDPDALRRVMQKGFDGVVHLAAKKAVGESMENPQKYAVNNLSGTINILNAMADNNIKYLVFSSSAAVYGIPQYLPIDERHPTEPINFYGFTKLDIEKLMNWYDRLKGIKYIALRYF